MSIVEKLTMSENNAENSFRNPGKARLQLAKFTTVMKEPGKTDTQTGVFIFLTVSALKHEISYERGRTEPSPPWTY